VSQVVPRSRRTRDPLAVAEQAGEQLLFWWEVIRNIPFTIRQYSKQIGVILADLSLGTGVFVIGGGVVGVVILLSTLTGSEVGFEGHNGLSVIGLAPLTGFISAYLNTREMAPIIAALGFAARIGCGFTSRLGAMRISEEIDALEVMAVPSLPFLVTTRMVAGFIAVIPLYIVALAASYLAPRLITTLIYGQSVGTYDHYFLQFLPPIDMLWSFFKLMFLAVAIILVHCYYGYTASGGPAGVGTAVGKAIRTSIVTVVVADFFLSFAIWGSTTTVRITG